MKKIITSIFILMFYLGCSPPQKDVLFANASDEQIIEWGKQYVVHSIEDSLKEGESYKIMEWILAEKKTSIPVEVWQMDNTYKKDSISGCVKLLDTRGIFDELAFIGNGDSAFVAFAVAYTIDEKNGNSSFLEKVFTLDKSGKVLDCSDYLSPSQKRKQIEENFNRALEQMGPILIQTVKEGAAMAGKDTSNVTSITINGKTYAKSMMVVAGISKNVKSATKISTTLTDKVNKHANGIMKDVMTRKEAYYNQYVCKGVILMECGSENNSFEEVKNTLEVVAVGIDEMLKEGLNI